MIVTQTRQHDAVAPGSGRRERLLAAHETARPGRFALLAIGVVAAVGGALALPAAASAAPAPSRSARAPVCANGTYTVVAGDGWSLIARKLGVTTKALLAANTATVATVIHPGRSVCVPAGSAPTASTTGSSGNAAAGSTKPTTPSASCANGTYKVVRGDGWLAIAKKVGVTIKALLAANNATTSTMLFAGRSICLPAGAGSSNTAGSTPTTATVRAYSAAENEAIIRAAWPDELEEEALRIARRESNLKNNAKNSCCYGLFQINFNPHKSWLAGIGVTSASQLLDPTINAAAAYTLYQRSGSFRPWAL